MQESDAVVTIFSNLQPSWTLWTLQKYNYGGWEISCNYNQVYK